MGCPIYVVKIKALISLCSYRAADLRLFFLHMQKPSFLMTRFNIRLPVILVVANLCLPIVFGYL